MPGQPIALEIGSWGCRPNESIRRIGPFCSVNDGAWLDELLIRVWPESVAGDTTTQKNQDERYGEKLLLYEYGVSSRSWLLSTLACTSGGDRINDVYILGRWHAASFGVIHIVTVSTSDKAPCAWQYAREIVILGDRNATVPRDTQLDLHSLTASGTVSCS